MPRAWRIIKWKYADHAFDGEGSWRYGSRWSSPGVRVAHASGSLSLATLEVLVHMQSIVPLAAYSVWTVEFREDIVKELPEDDLPGNWRTYPAPFELRALGDAWLRRESSLLLRVPSAIISHEFNYLINPAHGDFSKLQISGPKSLDVDPRVFGR